MIPFNKPFLSGREMEYIQKSISMGKISGNGFYTQKCQQFFEENYHFAQCLLTTSCTDALEMSAILVQIQPGDEVIVPSFTFVSTANAFVLRGAKIIFADSQPHHPNIDPEEIIKLVSPRTKAIIVVHYSGVACPMDEIMEIAKQHNLLVIEDAAHAIDSYYKNKPLGGIGHFASFSFHETKNIISGEGGMLVVNDARFTNRSEIIWEKGTNRTAFFKGEVNKYNWVDIGSSFLPSELTSAFLFAQLENLKKIQTKRKILWLKYFDRLKDLSENGIFDLPSLPSYATNNGHLFYMVCQSSEIRDSLIRYLRQDNIYATFHYLPLHLSPFYKQIHGARKLPRSEYFSDRIIRLPFYYELSDDDQNQIIEKIHLFYNQNRKG